MLFEPDDAEKCKKSRKMNWKSTVYKNILKSIVSVSGFWCFNSRYTIVYKCEKGAHANWNRMWGTLIVDITYVEWLVGLLAGWLYLPTQNKHSLNRSIDGRHWKDSFKHFIRFFFCLLFVGNCEWYALRFLCFVTIPRTTAYIINYYATILRMAG